jgi:7-cyano-7-deazaguanine synthase in queuosine biosynthesis
MEEEDNKKVPLLLFSGGMDSTYLLQWFLHYGDVDTLFVQANPHPLKLIKEKEARKKLFALFEKHYKHRVLKDHEIELNRLFGENSDIKAVQPISWLTAALIAFDSERHHSVSVGYVLGDQAPVYQPQFKAYWEAGWVMTRGPREAVPQLVFPLVETHHTKYDTVDRIDKRLVMATWVCETPYEVGEGAHKTIKACTRCDPCRLLHHTVKDWEDNHHQNYMGEVIKAMNPDKYPSSLLHELAAQPKDFV